MAKIYGTPIMAGGAGGMNRDLPPLLDNFKAFEGGGIDDGLTRLKDLPNGTKVKFGTYNSQTLVWRIAQDEGVTKAVLDLNYDTGKTVIGDMVPSSGSIAGNWAITGWLNATEAGGSWWANRVKYSDDPPETEPDYSSQDGFLHGWSETDRGLLQSIEWGCDDFLQGGSPEPYQLNCKLMICSEDEAYAAWNGERFCVGFGDTPVILRDYSIGADGYSGISGMGSSTMEGAVSKSGLSNAIGIWPVCAPNPEAVVSDEPDDDGCYTIDYNKIAVTIQADKMEESRAKELAGAVWVYGYHIPKNVNDGTKIQLTREEITRPDADPYVTLADIPASDAETETIVNLKESDGKLHPYLYLSNNYEDSGAGLLLRKDIYQKGQFHSSSHQYNGSIVDAWCEGTFLTTVLDTYVQEQLMSVNIQVQGAYISRKCFVLSIVEYNWSASGISEGNSLPYFKDDKARISLYQGSSADYYTRTYQSSNGNIWFVGLMGNAGPTPATTNLGYRPAVCIKKSFKLKSTPNEDGSYDMYEDTSTVSSFVSSEFTVQKSVSWEQTKDFHVRQFTFNSKKQYQTMLEGALASVIVEGAPAQVTDLVVSGSGGTATLTWVNPVDDPVYTETVVVQKVGSAPSDITDGTEIYRGTDETCTATGLEQSTDYYFAIYTVSGLGVYKQPVVKSYRFDFPEEPTSYSEIEQMNSSREWEAPETGWFKFVGLAKSGAGMSGNHYSGRDRVTGGSGGSGGIVVSVLALSKGEKVSITISGNVNINYGEESAKATAGKNGTAGVLDDDGWGGTPGVGGAAGTASGGNLKNIQGTKGTDGKMDVSSVSSVSTVYENYRTTGGYGHVSNVNYGTTAYVVVLRGNTNIPSPSQASVLSLIPKNNSVEATWENSGDPVQTGTMLVYNTSHTPKDPSDGVAIDVPLTQPVTLALTSDSEELQEDSKNQSYTITGVPNDKPVFVALFPYDKDRKYGLAKQEVEIPREHSWYDTQQELKAEVESVKVQMTEYQEYYNTTKEVIE